MREYLPLLIVGAVIGVISIICIIAYSTTRDDKKAIGFERNMKDSELLRRLLPYAKRYWKRFLVVLILMLFSISYSIASPLLIGGIEEMI